MRTLRSPRQVPKSDRMDPLDERVLRHSGRRFRVDRIGLLDEHALHPPRQAPKSDRMDPLDERAPGAPICTSELAVWVF